MINLERVVSAVPIYIAAGALILWGAAVVDKRRERKAAR